MTDSLEPAIQPDGGEPDPAAVAFVLHLGRALHSYGASAHRLEEILGAMADRLHLAGAQFFSQPTSIMASFGALGSQRTFMLRVEPGDVNLSKLAAAERVALDVAHGRASAGEGTAALERISAAPPPYGPVLNMLALAGISGAAGQLLGGGAREVAAATLLGVVLHLFALLAARTRLGRVFEPLAALVVSAAAVALGHLAGPISVLIATLAGLIVLLPGLTLTTALSELASRHLASGTAKLSGAFITFLGLGFGVALGNRLASAAFGGLPAVESAGLPAWAGLVAVSVAPLCAVVALRADARDAPWILAAAILGVQGGRYGAEAFGAELGAFVGAFAVGVVSNAYARWRRSPPAVVLVPGILLLVPGSVGFRSLTSLMERQAIAGIEGGFSMTLTAVALASGLLMASVVAPEPPLRALPTPGRRGRPLSR